MSLIRNICALVFLVFAANAYAQIDHPGKIIIDDLMSPNYLDSRSICINMLANNASLSTLYSGDTQAVHNVFMDLLHQKIVISSDIAGALESAYPAAGTQAVWLQRQIDFDGQ